MQILSESLRDQSIQTSDETKDAKKNHILVVNLVGFTHLTPQQNPQEHTNIQQAFSTIVILAIEKFRNQVIKNTGYAYLISFDTAADALHAGLKIESSVDHHNAKNKHSKYDVRMTVNTGERRVSTPSTEMFNEPVEPAVSVQVSPQPKIPLSAPGFLAPKPAQETNHVNGKNHSTPPEAKAPKPRRKHDPREIRIHIPNFLFETYVLGASMLNMNILKSRRRRLGAAFFVALVFLVGFRIASTSYPSISSFLKERSIRPANLLAGLVESEIFKSRIVSTIKRQVGIVVTDKPEAKQSTQPIETLSVASTATPIDVPKSKPSAPEPKAPEIEPEIASVETPAHSMPPSVIIARWDLPYFDPEDFKEGLEIGKWIPSHSNDASIGVEFISQKQGDALEMNYHLESEKDWVQVSRSFWATDHERKAILFYYAATGSQNDMEIKITDEDGNYRSFPLALNPDGEWYRVRIPMRDFSYWLDVKSEARKIFFAIKPGDGGAGKVLIDNVRIVLTDKLIHISRK